VNREDADGLNLFEGGFLGLDNIGPMNRSHLPIDGVLEQSDATGWMATYALWMAMIATILQLSGHRPALDLVQKFLEHFAAIAEALDTVGIWDEEDGLFYDRVVMRDGSAVPLRVRSIAAVIPLLAVAVVDDEALGLALVTNKGFASYLRRQQARLEDGLHAGGVLHGKGKHQILVGVTSPDRVRRMCEKLLDPSEFLSPYGLRSLSAYHREHPYEVEIQGVRAGIDYEPAESATPMFGGNSNWRGPVWFPLNYLIAGALERYHEFFGDDFTIEFPTGSGQFATLSQVADHIWKRLVGVFLLDGDGRRPCFGAVTRMQDDPRWRDNILFHEYFNGDDGSGLGASHQTGWTALVADVIRRRHGALPAVSDIISRLARENEKG
jgi:hypothetical protein